MDSVTQFSLGACVGVAVLGRKIGPRKAALTGGILGTLPDLDVFLAPEDPIDSFVQHRGWSHSLFVHAALTPVFGEIVRLWRGVRDNRGVAYLAVFLCLTTHALLDAVTVYGTRLLWPLSTEPIALGSIFIIDPLYTLPLLFMMIWSFLAGTWTGRLAKVATVCLGLSTAYIGWTAIAQHWMTNRAESYLADRRISPSQMMAIPTPFNTLVWRMIGIDGDRYFNLYMPLFGDPDAATLYAHDRKLSLKSCVSGADRIDKVESFSRGYFTMMVDGSDISVADLRMGLTPNYAFRFVIARMEQGRTVPVPTIRMEGRGDFGENLDWLLAKMSNRPETRPAEALARVAPPVYAAASGTAGRLGRC